MRVVVSLILTIILLFFLFITFRTSTIIIKVIVILILIHRLTLPPMIAIAMLVILILAAFQVVFQSGRFLDGLSVLWKIFRCREFWVLQVFVKTYKLYAVSNCETYVGTWKGLNRDLGVS